MRLFVAVLVVLTLLVSDASAITRVRDTWDYGVKGGVSLASYYNCDDCVNDNRVGFTGGFFAEFKPTPNFALQPEFLFVMKGWDDSRGGMELNYIEIPVLMKLKAVMSGDITPNIYAGPAVAFLTSAMSDGLDYSKAFKNVDFGIAFGGGADFVAGTGKIVFDIRYTLGLVAIPDNPILWEDPDNVPDIRNRALSFSIGYGW